MKIFKSSIKVISFFFISMLLSSSLIESNEKISRLTSIKKFHKQVENFNFSRCQTQSEGNFAVKFLFTLAKRIKSTFVDEIKNTIRSIIDLNQNDDENGCFQRLANNYNQYIARNQETIAEQIKTGLIERVTAIGDLGLLDEDKESIEKNKSNPRALCNLTKEIFNQKKKAIKKSKDKNILYVIDKCKDNINLVGDTQCTLEKLLDKRDDIRKRDSKRYVYDYIIYLQLRPQHKDKTFSQLLDQMKIDVESGADSGYDQSLEETGISNLNCSDMPQVYDEETWCKQTGLATKIRAIRHMITKEELKICAEKLFVKTFINEVAKWVAEKIVSVITNLFGCFVLGFIKIAFYVIKAIYNLTQASRATDISKRAEYWGDAVGYSVKVLLEVFTGGRKRFIKFK